MHSRLIQAIGLGVMVIGTVAGGRMLTPINRTIEEKGLRYTDVSVEGAPPFVVLGTAIGALRGVIVDFLWIKVHIMKEKGLYYEVMADSELITRLQPRFAAVWAFHGHNMAYNISVATNTLEERWTWVNAGIRLVRDRGLRFNPNNLVLHKELAFWFAHKIEGYADDAHLYYKREFAKEWHFLLGEPPVERDERIAWIKRVADAPSTLREAEERTPGVLALIDRLNASMTPFGETASFEVGRPFLEMYGTWKAITDQSEAASVLGLAQQYRANMPMFAAFDEIADDPALRDAWETLVSHVRKRVLIDEYNMSPQLMYEFTRDLGPIDWRHGQAHALYWSRLGAMRGSARVADTEDVYKMLNNDRIQLQAMQGLARYGRITFDPFSNEIPSRFPDPRWIDTIDDVFEEFYSKYYDTRGGGGDSFASFLENFMSSAVREAYRSGEFDRAERLLARLDERFGRGGRPPNNTYSMDLDVFVTNQIKGEYEFQPHLAPSEAIASLRLGFRKGIGRNQPEIYRQALQFVDQVIAVFRGNEYYNFTNKFGEGRMMDLLAELDTTKQRAFIQIMTDPTIQVAEKTSIWANVDKEEPRLRMETYDFIAPTLRRQFERHELSSKHGFDDVFPKPPGLEQFRAEIAAQRAKRQREIDEARRRGTGGASPTE